ncbi:MAG TPA: hypothetical protein VMR46_03890 [Candidatus Paceibacterota bacterium]|nr:hypothetical protein [Candidatus Paceibacterota bacterium]
MDSNKNIWIGIGIVVLVVGAYLIGQSSGISSGSITEYPVQCANPDATNFSNCKSPIALEQSEYFIDKANQSVTITYPSESNSTLTKRTDCVIVDSSNWSCGGDEAPPLGGFGFKNGIYFSGGWDTMNGTLSIIYVSQSQWNSINHSQDGPF